MERGRESERVGRKGTGGRRGRRGSGSGAELLSKGSESCEH